MYNRIYDFANKNKKRGKNNQSTSSFQNTYSDDDGEQFEKLSKYRIHVALLLGRLRFSECIYGAVWSFKDAWK